MFEERLRLIEGAEACRATASGMAAVFAALLCRLRAGDRVVASRALFGSCHYIIRRSAAALGHRDDAGRRPRSRRLGSGARRRRQGWRSAKARRTRRWRSSISPRWRGSTHRAGGLFVVDNVFATPLLAKAAGARRRCRRLFGDQAYRRAGPRRSAARSSAANKYLKDDLGQFYRHTGPSLQPVQRLAAAEGARNAGTAGRAAMPHRRGDRAHSSKRHPKITRVLYPGLPSHPQHALAKRQMRAGGSARVLRHRRRQGRLLPLSRRAAARRHLATISATAKSLVTHPATTTHSRLKPEERAALGIGDSLVRLSAGLEAEPT